MIGLQTEQKLAHLLKTISDSEKEVEIVRQLLAEQRDFEPYTAFKRIDSLCLGYIRPEDLYRFLKENGITTSEKDIDYLFRLLDGAGSQRLSYSDFIRATLPVTNPTLRQLVTQRQAYYVGKNQPLPSDVEWSLARVFDKEIDAYRKIELLKESLAGRFDFNASQAFKTIDVDRLGFLDHETLFQFFKQNNIIISDDDVQALLRRIDKDQDARISYDEFLAAISLDGTISKESRSIELTAPRFNSRRASPRSTEKNPPRSRDTVTSGLPGSEYKTGGLNDLVYHNYLNRSQSRSPKRAERLTFSKELDTRATPQRVSIAERRSPEKILSKSQKNWSPNRSRRVDQSLESYRTPQRENNLASKRSASRERISPLKAKEEETLAKILKDQIDLDQEIENLRNDLALRSDFNLLDLFKIFDVYGKGYITSSEFEDGLRELSVYPSKDDLYLIVRKFDKDADGLLRYSEFAEIFTPTNTDYAGMLTKRIPSYTETRKINAIFGYETLKLLKKFLSLLFQNEGAIENARQRLNKRPLFDLYDAFKALDRNGNGYVTLDEFREILQENGIYATSTEALNLIKRFDRDQDGKVSYKEFVNEITPKSPAKLY